MSIDFSDSDHARMQDLMEKSNEGTLTPEETAELGGYVNIANVLSVMHSRARVACPASTPCAMLSTLHSELNPPRLGAGHSEL